MPSTENHGASRNPESRPVANRSPSNRSPHHNRALGAGLTLAVTVALFAYGGLWLDRQLDTKPWFLLLLVILGIVGGMLHLIRVVAPEMWPFDKSASKPASKQPDRSTSTRQ